MVRRIAMVQFRILILLNLATAINLVFKNQDGGHPMPGHVHGGYNQSVSAGESVRCGCRLGAYRRHLTNTTEPSACGGDAASCQIHLTTCLSIAEVCTFWMSSTFCRDLERRGLQMRRSVGVDITVEYGSSVDVASGCISTLAGRVNDGPITVLLSRHLHQQTHQIH